MTEDIHLFIYIYIVDKSEGLTTKDWKPSQKIMLPRLHVSSVLLLPSACFSFSLSFSLKSVTGFCMLSPTVPHKKCSWTGFLKRMWYGTTLLTQLTQIERYNTAQSSQTPRKTTKQIQVHTHRIVPL